MNKELKTAKELTIKELEKMMKEVVKEFFANDSYVDLDTVLITVEDKYSFIDVEGRFGEECSEENHYNFKLCYSTRDSFEFIKGKFVQIVEDLLK